MDRPFVRVIDTHRKEHVINIHQIVELRRDVDSWEVWLTRGDTIRLSPEEVERIWKRLPGVEGSSPRESSHR
jgi:hypothetical protein